MSIEELNHLIKLSETYFQTRQFLGRRGSAYEMKERDRGHPLQDTDENGVCPDVNSNPGDNRADEVVKPDSDLFENRVHQI